MKIPYNPIKTLEKQIEHLEEIFSSADSQDQRRRIFWEIERTYRKMDDLKSRTSKKKGP